MRKLLIALFSGAMLTATASAEDVKIGIILGFTGPIESLTPDMAAGAELAIAEVNGGGKFMGGSKVTGIRGDSTCVDSAAAQATAERLVTSDKVNAIMGADCSGVTGAILANVAMANGVVMISPSATSPGLSTAEDNGLFFRTAPSDARQGQVVAEILKDRGFMNAAITYTNNDYGKGLADSIESNFKSVGGTVTINTSHEEGKGDYSAEVAALAQAGGDILVVAGYLDQGGKAIIQSSLDTGAFDIFYLPDGMIGDSLPAAIGDGLNGSIGDVPGTDSPGATMFVELAEKAGFKGDGPFSPESYDAAALIMLAMQAAGSTNSQDFKSKVMDVANAPGKKVFPGDLSAALEYIAGGGEVDYVGASAVELIGPGESAGSYREILVDGGKNTTVGFR
ncbi:MAG: ABC transporter substrate-binding protein [Proteobacteria bacterium]|jgi:branched-chain amino acid transport system substrate-binding protein|nr:ABC transporter substrate-binding protein [Pseudomonadota bacterium]MBT5190670.1 ABC transporter substrate-binding protein [Pseudomonadota bacterium]MBT5626256.1 ABC transporter substrate-binding protein [Pseudomonadota bacterium]MBT6070679.1 ABC transporter substrate-binding protein [Pseudomonadota bacterium]MBT6656500.1 ABC transporter substrate-binding protein [Pseudomonadota bacterium]